MNDELFADLLASVREGGEILQGKQQPSRTYEINSPDVKQIRTQYTLSQREFAAMLGVSIKTLQNWEQGRRSPQGAARILLQVAAQHPAVVREVVESYMPMQKD
jgi:putative transcriptional regulator